LGKSCERRRNERRFATYALGLMWRRRAEKAWSRWQARACPNHGGCHAAHERLTYFTRAPEWSDRDVRRGPRRYALPADERLGEL